MEFFEILKLSKELDSKLEVVEAKQIEGPDKKEIALKMTSKEFLTEEELFELFHRLDEVNIPIAISNVFINSERRNLQDHEVYSYFYKMKEIFSPSLNMSHIVIKKSENGHSLIFTNETTYNTMKESSQTIISILRNSMVANLEPMLEPTSVDHSQLIIRQKRKSEKESVNQSGNVSPRSGYKELKHSKKEEQYKVYFEGEVFSVDSIKTKNGKYVNTIMVAKNYRAVSVRIWTEEEIKGISNGQFMRFYGNWKYDDYRKSFILMVNETNFESINKNQIVKELSDDAPVKRIDLHAHTKMSSMDGISSVDDYVKVAKELGIEEITLMDHNSVQAYPDASKHFSDKSIKINLGVEFDVYDDINTRVVENPRDGELLTEEYVFFDLETTGISPQVNEIIEIGAVKYQNGTVKEKFNLFVKPNKSIPEHITELTSIKNEDVQDAPTIKKALKEFKEFCGDAILVAHNAKFDYAFLNSEYIKNGFGEVTNPIIDSMKVSWILNKTLRSHRLGAVARNEGILYDEMIAHRAHYDALILQRTFENLIHKLIDKDIRNINQLNDELPSIVNNIFPFHVSVIAKNEKGLKEIYKLVSESHIEYFNERRKSPVLPLSRLLKNREDILIGSGCSRGLVWEEFNYNNQEIGKIVSYFDYLEVLPISSLDHLVQSKMFTKSELKKIIQGIVKLGKDFSKPVVAVSNAHYGRPEEKIIRDIYISAKGLGGTLHPLFRRDDVKRINPDQHLLSTTEMLEQFDFLDEEEANKIVINNPKYIASLVDEINPIKPKLYTPIFENTEKEFEELIEANTLRLYGDNPLPKIKDRITREKESIIKHGYAVIYNLSSKAVRKSIEDGHLVGSRGSVGSSIAATLTDITEVNPLEPHYRCPNCKFHEFVEGVSSGYDLETKACPKCQTNMIGDGHWIPFETFLGFNADKVPDIDLNFSREYQSKIHEYIKELLGEEQVYRAGTISTVAERTAFGYVRNYIELRNEADLFENADIKYLANKSKGTKRTTGQHPGGLIVVPKEMDIYDFTPINYPGNDVESSWKTTHFDFNSLHDNLLKLDLLGHLDPSSIKMLQDTTNVDPLTIPMNDKQVLELFKNNNPLNYVENHTGEELGIIGLPEFGTTFVRGLVRDAKPETFADLVRISGLSHGTDVWTDNAKDLIKEGTAKLSEVISVRDDIMTYLIEKGLDSSVSFKIMESVRKGRGLTPEWEATMKQHNVPDWYIKSCKKIKYMFPKAHATAYVIMAYRIAWYKINYPLEYYATFFTKRDTEFDLESLFNGVDGIKKYKREVAAKGWEAEQREKAIFETYDVVLEMISRGYTIEKIQIDKSQAEEWIINKENNSLIPPFTIMEGLGEAAANKIVEQRDNAPFDSIEDIKARSGLNNTLVEKMVKFGIFENIGKKESTGQIMLEDLM